MAEYEWGQHVIIGLRDGLTREEIERIKKGPGLEGWSDLDRAILPALFAFGERFVGNFLQDLEGFLTLFTLVVVKRHKNLSPVRACGGSERLKKPKPHFYS